MKKFFSGMHSGVVAIAVIFVGIVLIPYFTINKPTTPTPDTVAQQQAEVAFKQHVDAIRADLLKLKQESGVLGSLIELESGKFAMVVDIDPLPYHDVTLVGTNWKGELARWTIIPDGAPDYQLYGYKRVIRPNSDEYPDAKDRYFGRSGRHPRTN